MIAHILKKKSNVPWVADFRDPWMGSPSKQKRYSYLRRKFELKLEDQVIRNSDKIICNTDRLKKDFQIRYSPGACGNKIVTLENGYDEADFAHHTPAIDKSGKIYFIHTGEVYRNLRNPTNLFKGLRIFLENNEKLREKLVFKFVGPGNDINISKMAADLGVGENIETLGHVNHQTCIKMLFDSDFLMLLQQSSETLMQIPAKAFEYLRVKKPIFCISPEGATSDFIQKMRIGIVSTDTPEQINRSLERFLLENIKTFYAPNEFEIQYFERQKQTEKLAAIFKDVTSKTTA